MQLDVHRIDLVMMFISDWILKTSLLSHLFWPDLAAAAIAVNLSAMQSSVCCSKPAISKTHIELHVMFTNGVNFDKRNDVERNIVLFAAETVTQQ